MPFVRSIYYDVTLTPLSMVAVDENKVCVFFLSSTVMFMLLPRSNEIEEIYK